MTPDRFQQIDQLFSHAAALPVEERAAFLDQACADAALRGEVEKLLAMLAGDGPSLGERVQRAASELRDLVENIPTGTSPVDGAMLGDLSGKVLGPYRLIRLVGKGGMGEIYAAEDTRLGRQVALKLLPTLHAGDTIRVRRFENEARAASALNHPNIVTIHDFGETEGLHFIASELVQGRTLRQLIAQGPMAIRECLSIATQIAGAIAAAHESGIVHRDIKPENVMVRPDGYVKVVDFGLAKLREGSGAGPFRGSLTLPGMVMGTVRYMSPEQARGLELDPRSDIFSLGVVLYEMAAGSHPFPGQTGADVTAAILEADPAPLGTVSAAPPVQLERIVNRCLRKVAAQRYQNCQELLADLVLLKEELDLSNSQAARSAWRSPRKRRLLFLAAGALALMGGAAAVRLYHRAPQWFETIQFSKVPADADLLYGVLSPSGRYIAYASQNGEGERTLSVRLRTSATGVRIAGPLKAAFYVVTFAPDESYLYYTVHPFALPSSRALYRIPLLGGVSQKLLDGVDAGLAFSPDSARFAYFRRDRSTTTLLLAAADGSGARVLFQGTAEQTLNGISWSADGREVLIAEGTRGRQGQEFRILGMKPEGGPARVVAALGRTYLTSFSALPDGSGYIANAYDTEANLPQIWFVSQTGAMRRITHDLSAYQGASLTADGKEILTNLNERESQLWLVDVHNPASAHAFTDARQRFDQPVWARDGSIVSLLAVSGTATLWVFKPDGSGQHPLPASTPTDFEVRACPDREDVVFLSKRSGAYNVWRQRPDGSEARRLTSGVNDQNPVCLAGGTILYRTLVGKQFVQRQTSLDGGPDVPAGGPSFEGMISPDGSLTLLEDTDPQTHAPVGKITARDGSRTLLTFPFNGAAAAWSPDSRGIAYVDRRSSGTQIWYRTVAGEAPVPLARFGGKGVFALNFSPDGRQIVAAVGRIVIDMVLIKDLH